MYGAQRRESLGSANETKWRELILMYEAQLRKSLSARSARALFVFEHPPLWDQRTKLSGES